MDSIPKTYFMDKLWQKEPNSDSLVELLPEIPLVMKIEFEPFISHVPHRFLDKEFEAIKNDRVANDFRVQGNAKFKEGRLRAAMEHYNRSLRFAIAGSENISLAYANRSTCFLRMNMYIECLNDIEMAKENGYPKRLMHKLNVREATCLERLKDSDDNRAKNAEPKLNFVPDEHFPCMANVLEIQSNEEFGRHIVAKCDIDVGQTVLVEDAFASSFEVYDRTLCFTCLKAVKNFIPCPNCVDAMFCDEKCMESNEIHKITCGNVCNRFFSKQILLDTILFGLNAFSTVEELMEFVGKQMASPKSDLPTNCLDARAKYGMFLKLNVVPAETNQAQIEVVYLVYRSILALPALKDRFNSKQKQRFLQHLIWQHWLLLKNSFMNDVPEEFGGMQILGNIQSLFNHSCSPNLHFETVENQMFCMTIRRVKKGEQLFIMYLDDLRDKSTDARKKMLSSVFEFDCKCEKCMPTNTQMEDDTKMIMDPIYQIIVQKFAAAPSRDNSAAKEKCFEFLRKYGHLHSSNEVAYVTNYLVYCLKQECCIR